MHVTARVEYALRALLALAAAEPAALTATALAESQDLPRTFLQSILGDLRRAGFVYNQRLPTPGYRLTRPAANLTIGEIFRAIEGHPNGARPENTPSEHLQRLREVFHAADAAQSKIIDNVTLADLLLEP